MNIIVGTAGHIDHGKTTLIKALTGIDTDRLPEEKKRGITIDLGFAELDLGEHRIGFVDVPGHERFVRNMLAGASGIDLVLLVIAADEGVMPQTREHFDICRLLGVRNGLVVLSRKDRADQELLDLVRLEAAELAEGSFLEGSPVIAVSAVTGDGLEELRRAIAETANAVEARRDDQVMRLPIDRSFVMKGFGTVVTGTLASGEIHEDDEIELMPARRKVRVRGLQTHGRKTRAAIAGQRVAVNLAGIDHQMAVRGMTLCTSRALEPVQIFDARVEVLRSAPRPLRSRQRVRVHVGTAEVLARVHVLNAENEIVPGSSDLAQFRLEMPIAAVMGETFIVRSYSPQTTIAGGRVIDPAPAKHRGHDTPTARRFLTKLIDAERVHEEVLHLLVRAGGVRGADLQGLQSRTGWHASAITAALASSSAKGSIVEAGGQWIDPTVFSELKHAALAAVAEHHKREPLSKGVPRDILKEKVSGKVSADVFSNVLAALERDRKIVAEQEFFRSAAHSQKLTADEMAFLAGVKTELAAAGLAPPKIDDVIAKIVAQMKIPLNHAHKLITASANNGELVKVSGDFYFERSSIDALIDDLRAHASSLPDRLIDVPTFKERAGVSRKFAIPLLEYFDRVGVTKRAGDKRIIV
ncbi:MAG: selenocysteine-specific translation elongation factor [Pyrinomonadaceae bacterium]